jgi:hypothetical protein
MGIGSRRSETKPLTRWGAHRLDCEEIVQEATLVINAP